MEHPPILPDQFNHSLRFFAFILHLTCNNYFGFEHVGLVSSIQLSSQLDTPYRRGFNPYPYPQ